MGSVIHGSHVSKIEFLHRANSRQTSRLVMRGKIRFGCIPTVNTLYRHRLWYHRAKKVSVAQKTLIKARVTQQCL